MIIFSLGLFFLFFSSFLFFFLIFIFRNMLLLLSYVLIFDLFVDRTVLFERDVLFSLSRQTLFIPIWTLCSIFGRCIVSFWTWRTFMIIFGGGRRRSRRFCDFACIFHSSWIISLFTWFVLSNAISISIN